MKVLILAAGTSTRLMPKTKEVPKTLLELKENVKIIDKIIETCYQHGLKEFSIVTGHGHDHVKNTLDSFADDKGDECWSNSMHINKMWFNTESKLQQPIKPKYLKENPFKIIINRSIYMVEQCIFTHRKCLKGT